MKTPFGRLPLPKAPIPRFLAVFAYLGGSFLLWPFALGFLLSRWLYRKPMDGALKAVALCVVILPSLLVGTVWVAGIISPGAYALPQPSPSPSVTARPLAVMPPTEVPAPTPQQAASFPPPSKTTDCHEIGGLPDPACTPGAVDPKVTQATITSTICVSGYTATIRPSSTYTNGLKAQQITAYGYTDTSLSSYEEDHLVSLELGGSPDSAANLWPEPYGITYGSKEKDTLENWLHAQVCAGGVALAEAQREIASDWVSAYTAHYGALSTDSGEDADDAVPTPVPAATQSPTATPAYDPSNPPVKMSDTKICHAQGDAYYDRTVHFTPYASMAACMAAGGRPSER